MLLEKCPLEIASDHRERRPSGKSMFPCYAYCGDMHDYLANQVPPHWHRELELLLLDSGTAAVTLADMQFELRAGAGYFVNAEKLHSIRCMDPGPCRYRSLVFSPAILAGEVGSVFDERYIRPLLTKGPPGLRLCRETSWQQPIFQEFEAGFSACAKEPLGYELIVRNALSLVVLSIQARREQRMDSRPASLREERLKQMIGWMDSHFAEPITLRDLAGAVNLSPRECERIFEQQLHITPMAYLLRRRIEAASALLAQTGLPVVEIGLQCGFSSHSYFSKQFRALTGYTPRDYRAQTREETEG